MKTKLLLTVGAVIILGVATRWVVDVLDDDDIPPAHIPVDTSQVTDTNDPKAILGQQLFFDTTLSFNGAQSCASCHNPATGFADNRKLGVVGAVSVGADNLSIGTRNTPSAAYAMFSPKFQSIVSQGDTLYIGGQFWDGRVNSLAEQAIGPPVNPVEMAHASPESVIAAIMKNESYQKHFKAIYGESIFNDTDKAYQAVGDSIQAFESTSEFAKFDSKYDRYLAGEDTLSDLETRGMNLYFSAETNCFVCHSLTRSQIEKDTFTNYEFHNIGVPRNEKLVKELADRGINPNFIDEGLAENPAVNGDKNQRGKFKTPTLRNVAVTAPYMHNGVFNELDTVVRFYDKFNNRAQKINPETNQPWGEPEVADNIAEERLEADALSEDEIQALVAFMKALTDKRYEPLIDN